MGDFADPRYTDGAAMRQPHVDDFVRLNQAIPELELQAGQLAGEGKRALLLERQVTVEEMMFEQNVDLQAN